MHGGSTCYCAKHKTGHATKHTRSRIQRRAVVRDGEQVAWVCVEAASVSRVACCSLGRLPLPAPAMIVRNPMLCALASPPKINPTASLRPCLVANFFQNSLSYKIFRRIHKILNIDKNN